MNFMTQMDQHIAYFLSRYSHVIDLIRMKPQSVASNKFINKLLKILHCIEQLLHKTVTRLITMCQQSSRKRVQCPCCKNKSGFRNVPLMINYESYTTLIKTIAIESTR